MNKITNNKWSCGLMAVSSLFLFGKCNQKESQTPNIVFILADDLGWSDLGCYGSSFHETKNIDKLAETGLVFTSAYSASPVCSPTRASIMTGKHPSRVNITDWIPGNDPKNKKLLGPKDNHELALSELSLAEVLKQNNYKTFFAGKWHLGDEGYFPEDQGFDYNFGGHHRGSPPGGYYSPYNNPKLIDGPEGEYLTDRLTDESINFIKKNQDSRFFLYLSYYTVHTPIQANKKFIDKYRKKLSGIPDSLVRQLPEHDGLTVQNQANPSYASMVHSMDFNVGRIMTIIDELELSDNTIIIFTSDNGGLSTLSKGIAPASVKPLRAGKGWCYEGGIRIPLIIKIPGKANKNRKFNIPVVSYDLYPSILELAGLKKKPEQHIDGLSIVPLINGGDINRDAVFWHFPHYHGSAWTPGAAILMDNWKLIEFYETNDNELYNLNNDIGEEVDLSEKFPDMVKKLQSKLKEMQQETDSQFPILNSAFNK